MKPVPRSHLMIPINVAGVTLMAMENLLKIPTIQSDPIRYCNVIQTRHGAWHNDCPDQVIQRRTPYAHQSITGTSIFDGPIL